MTFRAVPWTVAALLVVGVASAGAYQKLGDWMTDEGYPWLVGRWAVSAPTTGTMDIIQYEWGLDRHIVLHAMERQGDGFKYRGMMLYIPSRKEIVGMGADTLGGTHKVTWRKEGDGIAQRHERTDSEGASDKMEMVFNKVDDNTLRLRIYPLGDDDRRTADPVITAVYGREPKSESDKKETPKHENTESKGK